MARTILKIRDNEGRELKEGDEVILGFDGYVKRAWFYELRENRALFSATDPKKNVNFFGYENLHFQSGVATCWRSIKV